MSAHQSTLQEPAAWLILLRSPGIGPARFSRLLEHFGSPEEVLAAPPGELSAFGLSDKTVDFLAAPDWNAIERDFAWLDKPRNYLIRLTDTNHYPPLLRQIPQPPPMLFVHGDPTCLKEHQIAIVGARNPTPMGRDTARHFAAQVGGSGILITSGLAQGIDAAAHRGALEASGKTVAVMGTGLDRVYPAKHRELAHAIAERGALVSELALGTPPLAEHFPRRNRIISGLSLGVVVVEAALRSGSLITARQAVEQGREVFAIPGSLHNPMAKGCHALIREGAKLVETAGDILEELGALALANSGVFSADDRSDAVALHAPNGTPELDEEYRQLLACFNAEPRSVDALVQLSGLTAEVVSSMLLILELEGYVAALPGGLYSRPNVERF